MVVVAVPPSVYTHLDGALHVLITRVPNWDDFTLTVNGEPIEELSPDDTRAWFRNRGANMDMVEKALDYCWNFYRSEVYIKRPVKPKVDERVGPKI